MAKKNGVHVVPRDDGGWAVTREGSSRASRVVGTQREAIAAGRATAQREHTELVIHGANGQIRAKDSHGKDDCPPKG
jgi:uncharacterized protein YdaT